MSRLPETPGAAEILEAVATALLMFCLGFTATTIFLRAAFP